MIGYVTACFWAIGLFAFNVVGSLKVIDGFSLVTVVKVGQFHFENPIGQA